MVLLPLLGITWVVGVLAVSQNTTVFAWIFTILNSFQVLYHVTCLLLLSTASFLAGILHLCLPCVEKRQGILPFDQEAQVAHLSNPIMYTVLGVPRCPHTAPIITIGLLLVFVMAAFYLCICLMVCPITQVWDTLKRWIRCFAPASGMGRAETIKEISSNVSIMECLLHMTVHINPLPTIRNRFIMHMCI